MRSTRRDKSLTSVITYQLFLLSGHELLLKEQKLSHGEQNNHSLPSKWLSLSFTSPLCQQLRHELPEFTVFFLRANNVQLPPKHRCSKEWSRLGWLERVFTSVGAGCELFQQPLVPADIWSSFLTYHTGKIWACSSYSNNKLGLVQTWSNIQQSYCFGRNNLHPCKHSV